MDGLRRAVSLFDSELPFYRAGVGIMLLNREGRVFVGRRADMPTALAMVRDAQARGQAIAYVTRRLGDFAAVDRIETALRAASVRKAPAGEGVIRQGDQADNFYVIADGSVEVTQTSDGGGERVLRQMGPNEFFGEIGLLSGVPRTATVTAVEESTLISLPGDAFLELVSGGPGLTYQLLNLHRGATAE